MPLCEANASSFLNNETQILHFATCNTSAIYVHLEGNKSFFMVDSNSL